MLHKLFNSFQPIVKLRKAIDEYCKIYDAELAAFQNFSDKSARLEADLANINTHIYQMTEKFDSILDDDNGTDIDKQKGLQRYDRKYHKLKEELRILLDQIADLTLPTIENKTKLEANILKYIKNIHPYDQSKNFLEVVSNYSELKKIRLRTKSYALLLKQYPNPEQRLEELQEGVNKLTIYFNDNKNYLYGIRCHHNAKKSPKLQLISLFHKNKIHPAPLESSSLVKSKNKK
jgi:hypothetical protein